VSNTTSRGLIGTELPTTLTISYNTDFLLPDFHVGTVHFRNMGVQVSRFCNKSTARAFLRFSLASGSSVPIITPLVVTLTSSYNNIMSTSWTCDFLLSGNDHCVTIVPMLDVLHIFETGIYINCSSFASPLLFIYILQVTK
jgi:hypothetical protein